MLVTRVWKEQPGSYFCISSKSRRGKWEDKFFKRSEFRGVNRYVQDNLDKDLYWCPHGFTKPRRLKEYAVLPKLLWADLDEVDPSNIQPMPSIAWQSSPGRYVGIWIVDQEITEDLNRRLTYAVEADLGGWDLTQVLRVPNTTNYKYKTTPKVKLLWRDGPCYTVEEIDGFLPQEESSEPNFGEAVKVFKRYEKRLTPFARREILNGRPKVGKRSEVLWRLNNDCVEAGMTTEEAFTLLRVSPWNKFAGRRNGDNQLRRELEKVVSQKLETAPITAREDADSERFLITPIEDVEEQAVEWIWYPYLARGEVTILEGDPGLGKSYLAQMVGAYIVDGKKLPSVKAHKAIKGKVAYFDTENSAGTVTKRRLVDNDCENLKDYFQEEQFFMVDEEEVLDEVYEGLEQLKPDLVVFDTINTYIGKADTHKASETQQALSYFSEIAKRFNCSVLLVRHLTKATKDRALYRGQGSIAFAGLARVVLTIGQHPDDPDTRVMAVTKLNITRKPLALTFTIESLPDRLQYQDRSKFVWGDFVELDSDEIISVSPSKKERRTEVEEFLQDVLSDGPMQLSDLQRSAEARGITMKIVRSVAKDMGIVRETTGFGKERVATWALPSSKG